MNPSVKHAKIVSRLGEGHYKFFSTDSGEDACFDGLSPGTEPRPSFSMERVSRASLLVFTPANSFVSLLERMFSTPSVFRSSPSVFCSDPSLVRWNPSVFRSNPGEIHCKFFSTDSGKDACFDDLSPGTEPRPSPSMERVSRASFLVLTPANSFVSLVERMDRLELGQKHGIEDLKRDIGDNKERIRDMDSRIQTQFANMNSRIQTQFAEVDARFDRLERLLDRWLFKILGLVSYSHYSYSTTFSKGIWHS